MTAILATSYTDMLQPFFLEDGSARGRVLRLGNVVDTILSRHDYPECVSHLLAELLCVAALLSSNLKDQGIITIQVRGDGLVPLMVVDAAHGGAIRGYAQIPDESHAPLKDLLAQSSPRALVGEDSYLAITYDTGIGLQRYQGVVAFEGESLTDALAVYFVNSQQMDVAFALHTARHLPSVTPNGWVAGAMMIERLASEGGSHDKIASENSEEAWFTTRALFNTLRAQELGDGDLSLPDLLFRLFHEAGVRITELQPITIGCRCSRERVYELLMSMSVDDRTEMLVAGEASVTCQFCNQIERYSARELML